jgi:hypothetical protein
LALIEVTPHFAEYWDKSSSQGVRLEMLVTHGDEDVSAEPAVLSRASAERAADGVAAEPYEAAAPVDNVIPFARSERRWRR